MKYRTETVREGEELGPVDWSHPMVGESRIPEAELREIAEHPERWEATTDGGWPRFGWRQVERLAMYDGWPYWRPHPVFVVSGGPLGGVERHSFASVMEARRLPAKATGEGQ